MIRNKSEVLFLNTSRCFPQISPTFPPSLLLNKCVVLVVFHECGLECVCVCVTGISEGFFADCALMACCQASVPVP